MPTFRQQIEQTVDEGIRAGRIPQAMRQQYIDLLAQNEGSAEYFAGGFMRTADYTNKSKEREEQWRQRQAEVDAKRRELESWQAQAMAELNKARAEADRLRAVEGDSQRYRDAVVRYQQVLKDYNLSEHDPLSGQPAPTHTPPPTYTPPPTSPSLTNQPPMTGQWVSQTEASQALNEVLRINGELAVIQANHQHLYGSPLMDNIVEEAAAAGELRNLRGYWERKYNVAGKRDELAAKQREDELARVRQEEREKVMAELASDPTKVINPNGSVWQPPAGPLDGYMNSRAMQHSPVSGDGGNPGSPAPRVPEQVNFIQSRRESVEASKNFFSKHFNPDGSPITRGPDRAS